MNTDLNKWTTEELLAELRARQHLQTMNRPGMSTSKGMSRNAGLKVISSKQLVNTVLARTKAVYGTDDRQDLFQVKRKMVLQAADSVVALVKTSDLKPFSKGAFRLMTTRYRTEYKLCSSEPFASQPLGCFCSGFLVAKDVVATAGHCVEGAEDLEGVRFVFGFHMLNKQKARTIFHKNDVYKGSELIGRRLTKDGTDWALVRLERPVMNRKPLVMRRKGKINAGQFLSVIGHPNGLQTKYANGASVRSNSRKSFFTANLDTYGGNSGSPVFDDDTMQVEGILVRGENDFVSTGKCNVSLVCPDTGCRGEDVTRSTVWAKRL